MPVTVIAEPELAVVQFGSGDVKVRRIKRTGVDPSASPIFVLHEETPDPVGSVIEGRPMPGDTPRVYLEFPSKESAKMVLEFMLRTLDAEWGVVPDSIRNDPRFDVFREV